MEQQSRLTQIGNIRTLAILLVVLGHSIILYSTGWSLYETALQSAFNYSLWFALGYCLKTYQQYIRKMYRIPLIKWGLLLANLLLLVYALRLFSIRVLISLSLCALFIINVYSVMPEKTCSLVQRIDRDSFGIYLFHSPLIYITFASIPNAHPAIVVFINFVIFGAAAFGLTELVRKTKLKVLIGE